MYRWFEDFEYATWDLAVFYFGKRNDFTCKKCVHVESGSGTKWSFLYKFGKSDVFQKKFATQYQQVLQQTCHDTMSWLMGSFHAMHQSCMFSCVV